MRFRWIGTLLLLVLLAAETVSAEVVPSEDAGIAGLRRLDEITADLGAAAGKLPADQADLLFATPVPCDRAAMGRGGWTDLALLWAPTEFAHPPLYFDQTPLERYGVTRCRVLQPALSGVHFFGTVAILPAKLLADHPFRPVSQLGPHRAGTCRCPVRQTLRLQLDPLWLHPLEVCGGCP